MASEPDIRETVARIDSHYPAAATLSEDDVRALIGAIQRLGHASLRLHETNRTIKRVMVVVAVLCIGLSAAMVVVMRSQRASAEKLDRTAREQARSGERIAALAERLDARVTRMGRDVAKIPRLTIKRAEDPKRPAAVIKVEQSEASASATAAAVEIPIELPKERHQ